MVTIKKRKRALRDLIVALPFVACFTWVSLAVGSDLLETTRILSEPSQAKRAVPKLSEMTELPPDASRQLGCLTQKATTDLETKFYETNEGRRLREVAVNRQSGREDNLTFQQTIDTYKKINELLQKRLYGEESSATFLDPDRHTVGINATVSLFGYDLATKKGSMNEGAGMGLPWKWYPWKKVANLQSRCRATTFEALAGTSGTVEGPLPDQIWFSLAPTIFFSKAQNADDVAIQPALLFTFMDLLYIGPGFNLSGPNQGNVAIFFGIGSSLK